MERDNGLPDKGLLLRWNLLPSPVDQAREENPKTTEKERSYKLHKNNRTRPSDDKRNPKRKAYSSRSYNDYDQAIPLQTPVPSRLLILIDTSQLFSAYSRNYWL